MSPSYKSCMSPSHKSCISPKHNLPVGMSPKSTHFAPHAIHLQHTASGYPTKICAEPIPEPDEEDDFAPKRRLRKKLGQEKFHSFSGRINCDKDNDFEEQAYEVRGTFLHFEEKEAEIPKRSNSAPASLLCQRDFETLPTTPTHRRQRFT